MKAYLSTLLIVASMAFASTAQASPAVCKEVGSAVIFKNTLYGGGTGLVVTGLALLATNGGGDHAGQALAGGTLLGATLGMGMGVVDIATRDCQPAAQRFQIQPMIGTQGAGASFSWRL